jgi:hypothetical protein
VAKRAGFAKSPGDVCVSASGLATFICGIVGGDQALIVRALLDMSGNPLVSKASWLWIAIGLVSCRTKGRCF